MFIGIERKSLTKDTVTYIYYPRKDKSIQPGEITINIHTLEILQSEKSGEEGEGFDWYYIHAISRIRSNTKNKLFPETDFVAWG
ncbi:MULTISPECIES: hypothetical protein [Staphylococcus]|uniref:hypothetical protein n=1 Tax=Staphylococcus TaxID=1279 RepID=UPI0021CED6D8|nr:hypothetical protein [Staphylococcus sp. IVB6181]UXV34358.1 hypothetical protein MUA90_10030 [Staphylococcus sp. IVB6181]